MDRLVDAANKAMVHLSQPGSQIGVTAFLLSRLPSTRFDPLIDRLLILVPSGPEDENLVGVDQWSARQIIRSARCDFGVLTAGVLNFLRIYGGLCVNNIVDAVPFVGNAADGVHVGVSV
uniref:Uncharacterized protein n=1 Tax=Spongospora subterranea TaxID=70186 RepID=A0A0H5QS78_9EUKA|eukprot:CRZ04873.1 hypothetical protein [Spongospora subterranea]